MNLTEFLQGFAAEIDAILPDVAAWSAVIGAPATEDGPLMEALEAYVGQIERLSATASLLGLGGLSDWCALYAAGLMGVVGCDPAARPSYLQYLDAWPEIWRAYLAAPAEPAPSMALVVHLAGAPSPPEEAASLALTEKLSAAPALPPELLADAADAAAEIEVSEADTCLEPAADADRDVYRAFVDEAPDNAAAFTALMFKAADRSATQADIAAAKRLAHSFKGSANIVGIRGIAVLAHQAEDLLELIERQPERIPAAIGAALADAAACLEQMVYALSGEEQPPVNAFEILTRVTHFANAARRGTLEESLGEAEVPPPAAPEAPAAQASAGSGAEPAARAAAAAEPKEATLRVLARTVTELLRMAGELTVRNARLDAQARHARERVAQLLGQSRVLDQKVLDLDKLVTVRGRTFRARADGAGGKGFDPLELEQYNELYGATLAVLEAASDAREFGAAVAAGVSEFSEEVTRQGHLARDLRTAVVGVRMLPLSNLFPRLVRAVRQTLTATGKHADFRTAGGEIMIDSDILGALADPLLHILRNAVDHGIEAAETRRAAGKPDMGLIELSVSRTGNTVAVHIRDDGRGLDLGAIRAKAVAKGLISEDAALTDAELTRLILLPGFSTREQVSEVSGRGVGMDVVATSMQALKGSLDIRSEPGRGCQLVLHFQASLVTQHALLVRAGTQLYALPSHLVALAVPRGVAELDGSGGQEHLVYNGERWPVHALHAIAGLRAADVDLESKAYVLCRAAQDAFALAVDRIEDSRELIVQRLPQLLKFLRGVTGAAILGDGAVAPLIDPIELARRPLQHFGVDESRAAELAAVARRQARRVVVVDDSLSARKSVVQVLRDAGYEVEDAVDGLTAIAAIERFRPHVVFTDLEMPNMNGLELTGYLRASQKYSALPVAMVTSRTMTKHRELARHAGIDVYLTKPYTDDDLLKAAHQLTSSDWLADEATVVLKPVVSRQA